MRSCVPQLLGSAGLPVYFPSVDRHLKERLVGAAVLVAAAIILIPEMLTGPHDAASPATPEKAAPDGLKTYTIDLNAPKERAETGQATPPALEIAPAPAPQAADTPPPQAEPAERSANVAVQPAPQMAPAAQAVPERPPVRGIERSDVQSAPAKSEKPERTADSATQPTK